MLPCLWVFFCVVLKCSQADSFDNMKRQTISRPNVSTSCITPNNQTGSCISLGDCQPLLELLKSYEQSRNASTLHYLKRSKCEEVIDPKIGNPKVCCTPSPSRNHSQCGISLRLALKIVGGRSADLGNWPWIASLYYRTNNSDNNLQPRCEGSLISKDWVATAAHCFNDKNLILSVVRFGDFNLNDDIDDGATPVNVLVDEVIVHPQFSSHPVTNDVALIRLKTPVSFTANVRSICLIKGTDEYKNDQYYWRMRPYVVGFGKHLDEGDLSTALQETYVDIIDNEKCAKNYIGYNAVIDNRVICAGGSGKDSCRGSSGGPLAIQRGNRWYLIGIISFGVGCGDPNFPGVYTKMAEFSDWISNVTGISI